MFTPRFKRYAFHESARAESLMETMISVAVISIVTLSAINLVRNAFGGNFIVSDLLTVSNLAVESLDAIENIRDSNIIKFPGDPENCWKSIEQTDESICADNLMELFPTVYVLNRNMEVNETAFLAWNLVPTSNFSTDGWLDLYELFDAEGMSEALEMYLPSESEAPGFTQIQERAFQRFIYFTDENGALISHVFIKWTSGGRAHDLHTSRILLYAR